MPKQKPQTLTAAQVIKALKKHGVDHFGMAAEIAVVAELGGKDPVQAVLQYFELDELPAVKRVPARD